MKLRILALPDSPEKPRPVCAGDNSGMRQPDPTPQSGHSTTSPAWMAAPASMLGLCLFLFAPLTGGAEPADVALIEATDDTDTIRLGIRGELASPYQLERSNDLDSWTTVDEIITLESPHWVEMPVDGEQSFYRFARREPDEQAPEADSFDEAGLLADLQQLEEAVADGSSGDLDLVNWVEPTGESNTFTEDDATVEVSRTYATYEDAFLLEGSPQVPSSPDGGDETVHSPEAPLEAMGDSPASVRLPGRHGSSNINITGNTVSVGEETISFDLTPWLEPLEPTIADRVRSSLMNPPPPPSPEMIQEACGAGYLAVANATIFSISQRRAETFLFNDRPAERVITKEFTFQYAYTYDCERNEFRRSISARVSKTSTFTYIDADGQQQTDRQEFGNSYFWSIDG